MGVMKDVPKSVSQVRRHEPISAFAPKRQILKQHLQGNTCGQALVEFIITATVLMLILFGIIQLAIIGDAALGVIQYSAAGARYASIYGSGSSASSYGSTIQTKVSPSPFIDDSGLGTPVVTTNNTSGTLARGDQVTVTVTYDLSAGDKLFLPSFFGISLPSTLSNSESAFVQ